MNMAALPRQSTALNTAEDRNTVNSSEKKWEDIWGILSEEHSRMP